TFEDSETLGKIQYMLGKIALFDFDLIEARNYATNAQRIAIDEEFWWKSIHLLVDSHRYDYNDKDGYEKCLKILNKSIELIQKEKSIRLNKFSTLAYIEACLYFDLAEITYEGVLNGKLNEEELARRSRAAKRSSRRNSMHPTMFKRFSNVINLYQTSFEIFAKNGFKRDSIKCLKASSNLLKMFADDCANIEAKKDYFLQAFETLNKCLEILNELLNEALSLQSPSEIHNISLPIQREVSDIKLELCSLMTDMLEMHLNEIKVSNAKSSNKDNMTKVIELYAGSEHENLNDVDQLWNQHLSRIPDQLSVFLISCFYLNIKIKNLKCKTLYQLGRSFRIISELKYQLRKNNLNDESSYNSSVLNMTSTINKWDATILDLIKNYQPPSFVSDGDSSSKSKKPIRSNTALPGAQPVNSAEMNEFSFTENEANINILSDRDYNVNLIEESNLTNIADQELLKNLLIH
ncbi:cilia- and flagella-associated 46, partial [Brachionus plicatilis]